MPRAEEYCPCILCGKKTKGLGVYYTASRKRSRSTQGVEEVSYYDVEEKTAPVCLLCRIDFKHRIIFWVLGTVFLVGLLVSLIGMNSLDPWVALPFNMVAILAPLCAVFLILFYLEREPGDLIVEQHNKSNAKGIYLTKEFVKMLKRS